MKKLNTLMLVTGSILALNAHNACAVRPISSRIARLVATNVASLCTGIYIGSTYDVKKAFTNTQRDGQKRVNKAIDAIKGK